MTIKAPNKSADFTTLQSAAESSGFKEEK